MNALRHDPALVLADRWQRGFPLVARPFAELGRRHDLTEAETLTAFRRLKARGLIDRIGAVVRPHSAGASTLAAMAVPARELEAVAAMVWNDVCMAMFGSLCDDSGELRRFVNIYVNEEDIRFLKGKDTALKAGDEVSIVPAIAGG